MARLEFRSYRRQFKPVLQTHHGEWCFRAGIILRLTDETRVGFGEIAPISWFGSESFEQALAFCHQLPNEITADTIFSIPSTLPACQFGFESAWEAINSDAPILGFGLTADLQSKVFLSGLLPAGEAALQTWSALWKQGYRTFKWKIGIAPIQTEIKIFHQLVQVLPTVAKLRLDANGGLSYQEATEWLKVLDCVRENRGLVEIEFLEQPLLTDQFDAMLELSHRYVTALALDESVATLDQLQGCYQRGWRGIFVVKPAIAGSPAQLRQFCHARDVDLVFSSVFETAIGRQAGLQLATELSRHNRAAGFGVNHWFSEADVLDQLAKLDFEHLWSSL